MILSLFKKNRADKAALEIYLAAAEHARAPYFYADLKAPDTVDGRFEVLTLHLYAVLARLKNQGVAASNFAQRVFDLFFQNMDDSLREMGVGDMAIGRKIRGLAEAFYGRVGAYEEGVANEDQTALAGAIARNVYGENELPQASLFADYLRALCAHLQTQEIAEIMAGRITFPDPQALPANTKKPTNTINVDPSLEEGAPDKQAADDEETRP